MRVLTVWLREKNLSVHQVGVGFACPKNAFEIGGRDFVCGLIVERGHNLGEGIGRFFGTIERSRIELAEFVIGEQNRARLINELGGSPVSL